MSLTLKLSCSHHPRYNPDRDGEAGIRGACKHCTALFRLYLDYLSVVRKDYEKGE